eukprot:6177080-Pleurochrysis_carterae.AAC.3
MPRRCVRCSVVADDFAVIPEFCVRQTDWEDGGRAPVGGSDHLCSTTRAAVRRFAQDQVSGLSLDQACRHRLRSKRHVASVNKVRS